MSSSLVGEVVNARCCGLDVHPFDPAQGEMPNGGFNPASPSP